MIPRLPDKEIRAAIDAGQWQDAADLLNAHDRELRQVLAGVDPTALPREPWLALLHAQQALLEQMRACRDEAAHALAQLGRDRRGVRAYQKEAP